MGIFRIAILITLAGGVVAGSGGRAEAEFLTGHDITLQDLFHGDPFPGYTTMFVVNSTPGAVEVPAWGTFATLSVDLFDTGPMSASILITGVISSGYASSPNLADFADTNGDIAPFLSVSIGATDIAGMDASRLRFDANTIDLDFGDLTIVAGQSVRLDISARPVPEPAGLWMLGVGAVGAAGLARLRRAQGARSDRRLSPGAQDGAEPPARRRVAFP